MTYREQKAKEHAERWLILQSVLVYLGEVKNRRGYLNGSMGELTPERIVNLDSRINNTLITAEKKGANVDLLLSYALDQEKTWDDNSHALLLYHSLVEEAAMYMWQGRGRIAEDKHTLSFLAGTYVFATRRLRRYKAVSRDEVKSWLPDYPFK